MNLEGCYSHKTDNWKTPSKMYYYFVIENDYIDPCPYKATIDGLLINFKNQKLFINPPYSQIETWTDYAIKQLSLGNKIVMLIPARTDTKYFHKLLAYKPLIKFIKGRLKFENEEGQQNSAPFPSLLIYLEGERKEITIQTTNAKEWNK